MPTPSGNVPASLLTPNDPEQGLTAQCLGPGMGLSLERGFSRRQRYLLELEEANTRALPLETDTGPQNAVGGHHKPSSKCYFLKNIQRILKGKSSTL